MSDHQELIDATRTAHTKLGRWCRTCAAKWPCLTDRLAEALEQQADISHSQLCSWAAALTDSVRLTETIIDQAEAVRQAGERADAAERRAAALEQVMNRHEPCRCDPPGSGEENCNGGCFIREELASAQRRAVDCRAWHCSGHRQCELERGHDGRHFTTSLGNSFPGWDDSASVDVPGLLEALNDARAQVSAAERRVAELEGAS